MCEQVNANAGLMQVSVQLDDIKDSIAQVRSMLAGDLEDQLRILHDAIDSDPNEECKDYENNELEPLIVIAEDNKLN